MTNEPEDVQPENTVSSPMPSEPRSADELELCRILRIHEYQAQAVAKRIPLRSILASATGQLAEIGVGLESLIKQALPAAATSPQREERLRKAVDQLVRLDRQIERFADKELVRKPRRESKIINVELTEQPAFDPLLDETQSGDLQS